MRQAHAVYMIKLVCTGMGERLEGVRESEQVPRQVVLLSLLSCPIQLCPSVSRIIAFLRRDSTPSLVSFHKTEVCRGQE